MKEEEKSIWAYWSQLSAWLIALGYAFGATVVYGLLSALFYFPRYFEQKLSLLPPNHPPKPAPMYAPPLKPGQALDINSDYGKYWPGQPVLFKLRENWGFAIPPQYMQFWIQRDRVVRHPAPWNKIPLVQSIGFEFFMPDFGGYTPHNYQTEFHPDKVELIDFQIVGMGAEQPGASGAYPPNMFARATAKPQPTFDPEKYQEKYGLRCYDFIPKPNHTNHQYCYGLRDQKNNEYILLDTTPPPYQAYVVYPLIQAKYFTPRHGGILVIWRTHMKNFPRWRDIDRQIWRFIEMWSLTSPQSPSESSLNPPLIPPKQGEI